MRLTVFCLILPLAAAVMAGLTQLGRAGGGEEAFARYSVSLKDGDLKIVKIHCSVFAATGGRTLLRMPPRESASGLSPYGLAAFDGEGGELEVRRDGDAWEVKNGGRDFTFTYEVPLVIEDRYSSDVRTMLTYMRKDGCRFLGRDIFVLPNIAISSGVLVDVEINPGWKLYSGWRSVGKRMIVPALEELPSTMAVTGDYRHIAEKSGGTEVSLAIAGKWKFEDRELFDVIQSIAREEIALFGSSPRDKYIFVCEHNPVKSFDRFDCYGVHYEGGVFLFLDPRMDRSELFDTPMAIIAHEFFHNWNGDEMKPSSEDFLWFIEGATVYISYRVLLNLRIITPDQYEVRRKGIVKRYLDNPYIESVPIAQAANRDMADKDMVNLLYDGGFLVCEALDIRIRGISGGEAGLMDILRGIHEKKAGSGRIDEEILVEAIRDECGYDLSGFLGALIRNTAPPVITEASLSP